MPISKEEAKGKGTLMRQKMNMVDKQKKKKKSRLPKTRKTIKG